MGTGLKALARVVLLGTPMAANAALIEREGGLAYDTDPNVRSAFEAQSISITR